MLLSRCVAAGLHFQLSWSTLQAPISTPILKTSILFPTNDGHRHRKGSHGDIIFLTNRGEVTAYSPGLHGHEAAWQWQLLTGATWSNLPSPAGMMDAGYVVPTLKPFNLRMHDNQPLILAAGDQEALVISPGGSQLTSIDLPAPPTHALVDADFSNDGLTDLVVVTSCLRLFTQQGRVAVRFPNHRRTYPLSDVGFFFFINKLLNVLERDECGFGALDLDGFSEMCTDSAIDYSTCKNISAFRSFTPLKNSISCPFGSDTNCQDP